MTATSSFTLASALRYAGVILAAATLAGPIALAKVPATIAASPTTEAAIAGKARKRTRCEECGIVQAIRRIDAVDGHPPTYEITIKLRNGSMRTNTNATPGNWQAGDRIMLINASRAAKAPTF
jgi:hypothetical protein